ncbi:MAG: hypothetical protein IRZ33_07150 [Alicyclobacillaceae bacterium]|nr:hypothetical protein [Alicyclobacillaceae bacterium]
MATGSSERRRQWRWPAWAVSGLVALGWMASLPLSGHAVRVRADVPALTDFGQDEVRPASSPGPSTAAAGIRRALFFTLYADGRQQLEIRDIRDDAVAGFAGGHAAWRLDPGLMWLLDMPVYVRELTPEQMKAGGEGV